MSESRPKLSRRVAVTTPYPISIQRRYWNDVSGSMLMPLKMAGREIKIMLALTDAMNVAMVVFDRATHLYWMPLPDGVFSGALLPGSVVVSKVVTRYFQIGGHCCGAGVCCLLLFWE